MCTRIGVTKRETVPAALLAMNHRGKGNRSEEKQPECRRMRMRVPKASLSIDRRMTWRVSRRLLSIFTINKRVSNETRVHVRACMHIGDIFAHRISSCKDLFALLHGHGHFLVYSLPVCSLARGREDDFPIFQFST